MSELSQTSGIAENRIEELEAGELDPDLEMLLALSGGLGVQASALFIRTEEVEEASHEN